MLSIFKPSSKRLQLGLINCLNDRGLGTETRQLRGVFKQALPEIDFDIFRMPGGSTLRDFDKNWHNNKKFLRWYRSKDFVMTIETFMPTFFSHCRDQGVKTLWRPNYEFVDGNPSNNSYQDIYCIMTPQKACTQLLRNTFGLQNVVYNPWVTNLPIIRKSPRRGEVVFLFNAGGGGLGNRRNADLVIESFHQILTQRNDIHFILKTQVSLDVSLLNAFKGKSFSYVHRKTRYAKNLEYYKKADFSVAPSKWEGVGFALLESLYCGTPVLTLDAPPMNEWVQHKKTGFIAPSTFADKALPIADENDYQNGLNWVRAAQTSVDEIVKGIHWLADNRDSFYDTFNACNHDILEARKKTFVDTFRQVLNNELPG